MHGIAYRNGEEIVTTQARALLDDLDQLPYPDRDYEPEMVLGRSIMPVLASRVVLACSFCSIHTFYRALGPNRSHTQTCGSSARDAHALRRTGNHDLPVSGR